jgi:diaminohydroxyphosphoribosylaminopyrimidine deaminase/5-amino-6-(5-phosphoribosylamino)uracil reductase
MDAGETEVLGEDLALALAAAERARTRTSPNPWVGAVLVSAAGRERFEGSTEPPGGRHAEIVALDAAGPAARGGTLYVTLEPCAHHGRTGPCTERIIDAGVAKVVVSLADPDPVVSGRGLAALRAAGIEVVEGPGSREVAEQLRAYLHHRRTGRPLVVLKLASTLDGRTAAADGSSRWITSAEARADVHRLRSESDAIMVGSGTVRADDPALTVRLGGEPVRQPRRIVIGEIPAGASVLPAESHVGDIGALLDRLGSEGVLQVLCEGGAALAHELVAQGLVDRVVLYVAPALTGGDDGAPLMRGPGAATIEQLRRGRFVSVTRMGDDVKMEMEL